MKAINTHIDNADVCENGCWALRNMTFNNGKTANKNSKSTNEMLDENQVNAGTVGGIEAVVKAVNTHIDNADVCEQGCGALWNMTCNNGKNTDKTVNQQMKC